MTSWQLVRVVAGTFILLSLALGIPGSPIFVSPWWLAFTAFVGVNLLQSGLTKWCLMESIMRKLGASAGSLKEAVMHLVCPACAATNRVPDAKLHDGPVCGKCGAALMATRAGGARRRALPKFVAGTELPCSSTSGPTGAGRASRWRRTSPPRRSNCPTCASPRSTAMPRRGRARPTASAASRR